MSFFRRAILTHGGSTSNFNDIDGTKEAAKIGMELMKKNGSVLGSVVVAVRYLEDDPRFNAGYGSQIRNDGHTVQMDASCMISDGQFGAVACIEGIQNPIDLAHGVLIYSPHILLVGNGAIIFAKKHKIRTIPLHGFKKKKLRKKNINFCDTVGSIAFDGSKFAAALSSGGIAQAEVGRVGDVPLPGCGLFCGSEGAVACTGDGEFIALKILAKKVYSWLKKISPNKAAKKAIDSFPDSIDIGIIILTKNDFASCSRRNMAWSYLMET